MNRFLCLIPVLLATACVAPPIQYQPRRELVGTLGAQAAKEKLTQVIQRASAPRVGTIDITPVLLRYQFTEIGPFEAPLGTTWKQIVWSQLDRVDIYPNFRAFVYQGGVETAWLQFASVGDAQEFADLMMSFKRYAAEHASTGGS